MSVPVVQGCYLYIKSCTDNCVFPRIAYIYLIHYPHFCRQVFSFGMRNPVISIAAFAALSAATPTNNDPRSNARSSADIAGPGGPGTAPDDATLSDLGFNTKRQASTRSAPSVVQGSAMAGNQASVTINTPGSPYSNASAQAPPSTDTSGRFP